MPDNCFFYSSQSLEVIFYIPIARPPSQGSKTCWWDVVDGFRAWWLEESRTWQPYQAVIYEVGTSPSLGGNSDDPVTQSLCVTCPPATLDPQANRMGGFTSLRDITTNKQSPKTSSHRTNVQTTANGDSLLGFWFNTKRLFMKHFWASRFHLAQPRSGAEPSILKINRNRWIKTGITCFFKPHRDQNTGSWSWEL